MTKKIKLLGGLFILAIALLANLQISLNSCYLERLLVLNSIEVLADSEGSGPEGSYNGYELRAGLCEDGSNLYRCERGSRGNCTNLNEDLCEPASSPDPYTNTVPYKEQCALENHNWMQTHCFRTCTRCHLQTSLCND